MRTFFISLFAILLALQASVALATEMQYGVPAPTIFESQIQELQDGNVLITGVTFNNTVVDVYIDGVFNGRADVVNDDSGVASFAYKSFLPLTQGQHSIYAVARSLDEAVRSKQSTTVSVTIPSTVPAPTNLSIELDDSGKSKIVGNVLNGYEVEIYIEGRKFVSFIPPQSVGSVTSFWYKPGLPAGDYTVAVRSKSPEGVLSSFVSQVLTFGSPVYEKISEENKTNNDVAVVQKDDNTAELVIEKAEEDVSPVDVLDELETQDEVVIVDEKNNDAKVIIDNTESNDKVVLDNNKTTEEIVVPTTKDDEVVIFGEDDELNSEINGGVSEVASDNIDDSRKTGFVLLLIIVIILAIWYIREKQKALLGEKEEKNEENKDQITMDEIKEKIQHVVEEAKQEKQEIKNDNIASEQKKNNKKKKKNKKRRR